MRRRYLIRMTLIFLSLMLAAFLGLYFFQDQIIFQTVRLNRQYVFQFERPFEEHFIPVANGTDQPDTLNAVLFRVDSISKGWIIYFHGNRGNLQRWGRYAEDLTKYGYDVLVVDYRGYGKSTGRPTEEALYADAKATYDWAQARMRGTNVVIYGRSLGAAVASNLAASVRPRLLILETPFDEIRGVIIPYARSLAGILPLKYTFSNTRHLRDVLSRVVIFHGTKDPIVPLSSALRLKDYVKSTDDFVILEGGTHINLGTFVAYQQKLQEVLTSQAF